MTEDLAIQFLRTLPKWGCRVDEDGHMYWLEWESPDFWIPFWPQVLASKIAQQRVIERCQTILDSGVFKIDWVEIWFRPHGLTINVPGNACGIYPDMGSFRDREVGSHNIDTPTQCFSLTMFLLTAVEEITHAVDAFSRHPGMPEEPSGEHYYWLEQKIDAKDWEPWEVQDGSETIGVVFARTWNEAEETANQLFSSANRVHPAVISHIQVLSPLRVFEVTVRCEQGVTHNFHVLAANELHAQDIVEQHFRDNPTLFLPDIIEVSDKKGKGLSPMIFRTI